MDVKLKMRTQSWVTSLEEVQKYEVNTVNTFLSSHSENLIDFVDAPLVTVGVIGVWNDVM